MVTRVSPHGFQSLDDSIVKFANHPEVDRNRLAELDRQLVDLIDFLDPTKARFPLRHQERSQYFLPPRSEINDGKQ
jgi:hypothetical protein